MTLVVLKKSLSV